MRQVSDVPVIMLPAGMMRSTRCAASSSARMTTSSSRLAALALMGRIKAVLRRTRLSPLARGGQDFTAGPLSISFDSRRSPSMGRAST